MPVMYSEEKEAKMYGFMDEMILPALPAEDQHKQIQRTVGMAVGCCQEKIMANM